MTALVGLGLLLIASIVVGSVIAAIDALRFDRFARRAQRGQARIVEEKWEPGEVVTTPPRLPSGVRRL